MLRHIDKTLFFLSLILFLIGIVMIFSASNVSAIVRYKESIYTFFAKQALIVFAGYFLTLFFVLLFRTSFYPTLGLFLLICSFLMLIYVHFYGIVVNDSKSWMRILGYALQPSEFVKVSIILAFSMYYTNPKLKRNSLFVNLIPFVIVGIMTFFIVLQPDKGTALIVILIFLLLYLLTPVDKDVKFKTISICSFVGLSFLVGLYFVAPSKFSNIKDRIDYRNPCSKEKFYTNGNQVCNSLIAFNNGGLIGKGLGKSTQKYLYLSESHTDFIFAIVVEELGFLGGAFIILLYLWLLIRIVMIGKRSTSDSGALICYGVAIYLFLHIAINLCGVMGITPLTGVPLPFISSGGSFALSVIFALTMVQRVAIETKTSI